VIRHWAIACVALALLAGCTRPAAPVAPDGSGETAGPATHVKIAFAGEQATPAERTACEAAGGTVGPGGMLGYDQCVQPYADAGAACKSADDCLGRCLLSPDSDAETGQPTEDGVCQATDSAFGCMTQVDDGTVHGTLCID
tara:strand:- start:725 stop:1147 length:423 start_codon:yes stop_codon:yes gene_type:complete